MVYIADMGTINQKSMRYTRNKEKGLKHNIAKLIGKADRDSVQMFRW